MKETTHRQSLLSSLVVMASTLSSRLLGFIRIALISALFGAGSNVDVMNWAFSLPNNFRKLLAEGALSTAFIPEFSRQIQEDPKGDSARELSRSILGLLLLIVLPICILIVLFPHPVVSLLSSFDDPNQTLLATDMLRLVINYLLLVALSALMMGILNSYNRFFIPAITPLLFSISVISSLILFHKQLGIFAMAVGILLGGVLQVLFQLPSVGKLGYIPVPSFRFGNPAFKRVLHRWFPIMLTSSIFAINQQVAHYFASGLEEGSLTALANALVFWQMPFGIFFNSIATVTYPKLSRQSNLKDWKGLASTVHFGYKTLFSLLIPSMVILMTMAPEIIAVALQRKNFELKDTLMAGEALFAYTTGLLSVALYNFTQRVYFSMGKIKPAFYSALLVMITDILLTLYFLLKMNLGVQGLAFANAIAFTFGFLFQLVLLRNLIPLRDDKTPLADYVKVIPALIPAISWVFLFKRLFGNSWWEDGSSMASFGLLALEGLGFIALMLGGFLLFKIPILSILRKKRPSNED